jgi:hypothetical protein
MNFSAVTTAIYSMQDSGMTTYMVATAATSSTATQAMILSAVAQVMTSYLEMKIMTSSLATWGTI